MIFVPLLHYFKCKNSYSGNEYGLRYRMIPGKRTVPDPDGGDDIQAAIHVGGVRDGGGRPEAFGQHRGARPQMMVDQFVRGDFAP